MSQTNQKNRMTLYAGACALALALTPQAFAHGGGGAAMGGHMGGAAMSSHMGAGTSFGTGSRLMQAPQRPTTSVIRPSLSTAGPAPGTQSPVSGVNNPASGVTNPGSGVNNPGPVGNKPTLTDPAPRQVDPPPPRSSVPSLPPRAHPFDPSGHLPQTDPQ